MVPPRLGARAVLNPRARAHSRAAVATNGEKSRCKGQMLCGALAMSSPTTTPIRDPLTEKFSLGELPKIAPWIYDEVTAIGIDEVEHTFAEMGEEPQGPHSMQSWVAALSRNHPGIWAVARR
jgi:hypothetical protein